MNFFVLGILALWSIGGTFLFHHSGLIFDMNLGIALLIFWVMVTIFTMTSNIIINLQTINSNLVTLALDQRRLISFFEDLEIKVTPTKEEIHQ